MKYQIFLILLFIYPISISAQMLLENKEGDSQFIPLISIVDSLEKNNSALIKLNTGDQSIGFDYFGICNDSNRLKYKFWGLGLKSKPTDGYAAVLKNNNFNPGITINGSITQVKILDREATKPENGFIDWGAIYFNYSVNKYQLFKEDTVFKSQLSTKIFNGLGIGLNYNFLIQSRYLISLKIGYARKSNYSDLNEVEIKDVQIYFDSISNTSRQVSKTKTARQGKYNEFDANPFNITFTKLTPDGSNNKIYTFGYNLYMNTQFRRNEKSIWKAGCILFLAKNKDGVSTPILGLDFQFDDFFDSKNSNNGLFNRLSIGITSSISI